MAIRDRTPIKIEPGVIQDASPTTTPNRWYDVNLVRWQSGTIRPVGGWEQLAIPDTASPIRATYVWSDNTGIVRTALLCEQNVYIIEGNVLFDISPVVALQGPSGDVTDGGYGDGPYGVGTYGTPRPPRAFARTVGPAWTLDNWGEDLLIMSSYDGRLLRWSPGDLHCLVVPGAPIGNRTFVVTAQRHVVMFGLNGDPAAFGWCSSEDIEDWDFASTTNSAGENRVEPSAPITAAVSTKFGVLFWSSAKTYLMRYYGLPYIYTVDEIADETTPITAASVIGYAENVAWIGDAGFWTFNGSSVAPINCPMWDWYKNNNNPLFNRYRSAGMFLGDQLELWWFFPSLGSQENDLALYWNFKDGWWSIGRISRTCGYQSSYTTYPYMCKGTKVFVHEKGKVYPDAAELPYAETSSINLKVGSSLVTLMHVIADTGTDPEGVVFTFKAYENRMRDASGNRKYVERARLSPNAQGFIGVGITGRDITMRLETPVQGLDPWTIGIPLFQLVERGS